MNRPFSGFFQNDVEICQSDEWVIRALVIVTDLFQNRAEHVMFGHPTRNTFDLVAPICRFLNDDTHRCMVTRYGPFTKILKYIRIAVEIACFSHMEIDECPVNSGQSAYCTISCTAFPCEVRLCDFEDMLEKRPEKGSLPRITVRKSLVPNVESSFFGFTECEVTSNNPKLQGCRSGSKWTFAVTRTERPE